MRTKGDMNPVKIVCNGPGPGCVQPNQISLNQRARCSRTADNNSVSISRDRVTFIRITISINISAYQCAL